MITSRVNVYEHTGAWERALEERTLAALNHAAEVGAAVATAQADGITDFHPLPAGRSAEGFRAGVNAKNAIWRVFDKGSLGKRVAKLKRDRRKKDWPVTRRGSTFTAHRHDPVAGGVAPRNISAPARLAGRKALIEALKGL